MNDDVTERREWQWNRSTWLMTWFCNLTLVARGLKICTECLWSVNNWKHSGRNRMKSGPVTARKMKNASFSGGEYLLLEPWKELGKTACSSCRWSPGAKYRSAEGICVRTGAQYLWLARVNTHIFLRDLGGKRWGNWPERFWRLQKHCVSVEFHGQLQRFTFAAAIFVQDSARERVNWNTATRSDTRSLYWGNAPWIQLTAHMTCWSLSPVSGGGMCRRKCSLSGSIFTPLDKILAHPSTVVKKHGICVHEA